MEDNLLPAAEALTLSFEEKRWLAMNAGAYSRPAHGASEQAQTEVGFVGEPLPAHTFVLCLASERFQTQVSLRDWRAFRARCLPAYTMVGLGARCSLK